MRTNEATVNKITKISKMNIFLLFSLLFCLSVAKEELPFSLEQLLEDNPDLIKLIEKRLGSEKQSKGDENPLDESDVEDEKEEKYATAGAFSDTEGSLPNEKYPTILNTKNRDKGKCIPKVRMSSIIRSNASLKNGAKFLAKLEKRSDAECRERCCNISRCNLAVFENKVILWSFKALDKMCKQVHVLVFIENKSCNVLQFTIWNDSCLAGLLDTFTLVPRITDRSKSACN